MYYGADEAESYRRVAYYVDRILKGAKPADLPVEQPMKFEFVINLKTAKQIGVRSAPGVLAKQLWQASRSILKSARMGISSSTSRHSLSSILFRCDKAR